MNWYRIAQQVAPISVVSYFPSIGELGISFKGSRTYIYPNVSPFLYDRINVLLRVKNHREVSKILRNLSVKKEEVPEETQQDRDEMLDEVYERGFLS